VRSIEQPIGSEAVFDELAVAQRLADRLPGHEVADVQWREAPASFEDYLVVAWIPGRDPSGRAIADEDAGGLSVVARATGEELFAATWTALSDVGPYVAGRELLVPPEGAWTVDTPADLPDGVERWDIFGFTPADGHEDPIGDAAMSTYETTAIAELAQRHDRVLAADVPLDDEVFVVAIGVDD
jgi:hypothetical protein